MLARCGAVPDEVAQLAVVDRPASSPSVDVACHTPTMLLNSIGWLSFSVAGESLVSHISQRQWTAS